MIKKKAAGAIFLSAIALKLYAQGVFTFGQARLLANLSVWEFQQLLGQHHNSASLSRDRQSYQIST